LIIEVTTLKQGIYEEIINDKIKNELSELPNDEYIIEKESLDVEEAKKALASYISTVTRRALNYVRDEEKSDSKEALLKQIQTCNSIIQTLSYHLDEEEFQSLKIDEEGEVLTSIFSKLNSVRSIKKEETVRPVTSIAESSLFTGSSYEPNMLHELKKEILSSNHVDLLVSFIKWSAIRVIFEDLKALTDQGGTLRIITTSYMGATDFKAIMELSKLHNTEIKISYDDKRTRLHAKAYLFRRETGFTTAYIGSSNLSHPALTAGLEWNMKISEKDSIDIIKKFQATFESYWNDDEFKTFHAEKEEDQELLQRALKKKDRDKPEFQFNFDIQPYYYQKEMLENIQVEREVFGRHRNLLVAATGVGKTVISAFDFKRFMEKNGNRARLLFVAHREEILNQSRDTFRAILKDFNFGELLVGGNVPSSFDHLFVSIQSFNSMKLHEKVAQDFYDFIIVDEFHHAAAKSYQTLLNHFIPQILLGLTATPERMDGEDVLSYFDGRIASEMRLTEAIDRKLLSPFQYFCVSDTVDLSNMKWRGKGYDLKELENVYTNDKIRSNQIVNSVYKYVTDIDEVKGLGFCVGVEHAKYMANYFNERNIPSIALYGETDKETRKMAQDQLKNGDVKFIFVVDLYNEGVDIPDVNTILFLRPTESLTVFLQQLGRGLRLVDGKECLTVLDFIGQAHKNYSFEEKFRALVGRTKHSIKHYVDQGFSNLPKGSFIQLEKQAKDYILRNIKATENTKRNLIDKLKVFQQDADQELTLSNFLNFYGISLHDFFGRNRNRTFQRMLVEADVAEDFDCSNEDLITKRIHKLFHLNSEKLLSFCIRYILGETNIEHEEEQIMLNMFYYSFYQKHPGAEGFSSVEEGIRYILSHERMRQEILDVLQFNYNEIKTMEIAHDLNFTTPLTVHSVYSKEQILAALGFFDEEKSPTFREGVKHFKDKNLDSFFTTLNKSEKDFSPSTLYDDYAINEKLFHWQSQSTISETSNTAQRYIHHKELNQQIALFVREYNQEYGNTAPFTFLGTCEYVEHYGSKPVSFKWRLRKEMPPALVPKANKSIV